MNVVALFPDGHRFASGSDGRTVKIWDHRENLPLLSFKCKAAIHSLIVLDDETIIAGLAASNDDEDDAKIIRICFERRSWSNWFRGHHGSISEHWCGHVDTVSSLVLLQDRTTILSGSHDHTLKLWCSHEDECKNTLLGHSGPVTCLILLQSLLTESGTSVERAASGSTDLSVIIWNLSLQRATTTLWGHNKVTSIAAVSLNEIVVAYADFSLLLWDIDSTSIKRTFRTLRGQTIVKFAAGMMIRTGNDKITTWNFETEEVIQTIEGHSEDIRSIVVMADNKLISSSNDSMLRIWGVIG